MKLLYSPFRSFIPKSLVAAHEAGSWDDVTLVPTFPLRTFGARS